MHMADALLSPAVGGIAWAASGVAVAIAAKRLRQEFDDSRVPLMGVLAAFVFAAQMINFTIPGTGSSGHLAGGMLLAILLGPEAALISIASVLGVQALFFADGGLLALGCNILNLGVIPSFFVYPLLFRPLAGKQSSGPRFLAATIFSALIALQIGALGVVTETSLSGVAELPFTTFAPLMAAIHLPIGLVEGFITALVVGWMVRVKPDVNLSEQGAPKSHLAILAVITLLVAGLLSWYASEHPDGLEWSIARITGEAELAAPAGELHTTLEAVQEKAAPMPDYDGGTGSAKSSTSLAGIVGSVIVLLSIGLVGWFLRILNRRKGHIDG